VPSQNAVSEVNVIPVMTSLPPGGTDTFVAVAQGAFATAAQVLSSGVQWTASAGSITSAGVYTAPTQLGSYQIMATYGGVTGAATANVVEATWEPLKVGAGGWVVGMTVDPSGSTYLVRTDTYGAYVGTGSDSWKQLVTSDSMPADFVSSFTTGTVQIPGEGIYEIVVAPPNPSLLYMFYRKKIFKSTNRGTTWTQTAFSYTGKADPNDSYRFWGQKMAVDPANASVVYVGTVSDGLYVTSDGDASWSLVSGVGVPGAQGITGITFDPNSGTTGGKTNKIYACRNGTGVYATTNAGSTWSLLTGSPTTCQNAAMASDGIYYVANGASTIHKWNGSACSDNANSTVTLVSVATDPFNAARIIGGRDSGHLVISTNRGATWVGPVWGPGGVALRVATDIPWLASGHAVESYMGNANMVFDPVVSNKLWFAEGIGVWYSADPGNTTQTVWNSHSLGIEQLVAHDIAVPPGGPNVLVAGSDRSTWTLPIGNSAYPIDYNHMGSTSNLIDAWAVNYSAANHAHIVSIINDGPELSGYSLDSGLTWTVFPAQPGTGGTSGDIAATSIDSIIAVIGNKGLFRSTNRGASWTQITPPNASTVQDLHNGFNTKKHVLAIDGVTPTTVYLYWYSGTAGVGGVYRSTDSGATWTQMHDDTGFSGDTFWQTKLRSVPGQAGHLFLVAGQAGGDGQQNPAPNTRLWRSTDAGANWTSVPNVREPYDVALGKAATGQSYPAIYFVGWYNNVYGIWRSIDNASTWTQIGLFPFGNIDLINVMAASQDTFGEVYVAFQGSGWARGILP